MRFARTAGLLLAILALVRCGAPVREVAAARAEPPVLAEVAVAPAARAVVDPDEIDFGIPVPTEEIPGAEVIRNLVLGAQPVGCGYPPYFIEYERVLLKLGARAFRGYEVILADPKSEYREVYQVCRMVIAVQADRRRFVPLALARLATPQTVCSFNSRTQQMWSHISLEQRAERLAYYNEWVRTELVAMLGAIGDEREAPAVARHLTDGERRVRTTAATALVKLGTHAELDLFNARLKPGGPALAADELQHLTQCRDALAKRLKEHPVPKTLTN